MAQSRMELETTNQYIHELQQENNYLNEENIHIQSYPVRDQPPRGPPTPF
jgi:hypothetical protein